MRIVTAAEMKSLDQMAIQQYGIPSLLLMENAGRGIAELIRSEFETRKPASVSVLIFCGKGNNGGDGLVCARHLSNAGYSVKIVLMTNPTALKEDPAFNYSIISRMKIPVTVIMDLMDTDGLKAKTDEADLIVDALFGIGLKSPLVHPFSDTVESINRSGRPVVSVDIPSGLDADTGEVLGTAVKAHKTATLGLPKKGLYEGKGPLHAGKIHVVDISLPREIL